MNRPAISLIIPVYNVEPYIAQCLDSIVSSTAAEELYEVIVVNDGTPDHSMDIVEEYACRYSNMTIINQQNQGLSAARMAGAKVARGEYIWFIDSDDWLQDGALDKVVSLIGMEPKKDVYATPLRWRFEDNRKDYLDIELDTPLLQQGKDILKSGDIFIWASQRYIFRRDLLSDKNLFFPLGLLHEDEYFNRVLLYQSRSVLILNESLYNYRQRADSIMGNRNIRSAYDMIKIYRLLKGYCMETVGTEDREWFYREIVSNTFVAGYYEKSFLYAPLDFFFFKIKNLPYMVAECHRSGYVSSIKGHISNSLRLMFPKIMHRK